MRNLSGLVLFASISLAAFAQQPPSQPRIVTHHDGGVSEVLQSIYIPPLVNAPFTLTLHTEWAKPIGDGGNITVVNQRRIARDSQGRIYQERWLFVPKDSDIKSIMNLIQIVEPAQHLWYNCGMLSGGPKRCDIERYTNGPMATYSPAIGSNGPLPDNKGYRSHDDLGSRQIEGIPTTGTRDSITYNPGAFGNDRAFTVSREYWQAPSLGINLISILDDPRIGKQTFIVTDIQLGDPDPALFEPPAGHTIVDLRKPNAPEE
jgi:hypothetical protein